MGWPDGRGRVEDVGQHRNQHSGEQPPEACCEHRSRDQHHPHLAPNERRHLSQRAADRCHRRELVAALGHCPEDEDAVAAATNTIANTSSRWLMPVRSTVVIEVTVCAVC